MKQRGWFKRLANKFVAIRAKSADAGFGNVGFNEPMQVDFVCLAVVSTPKALSRIQVIPILEITATDHTPLPAQKVYVVEKSRLVPLLKFLG